MFLFNSTEYSDPATRSSGFSFPSFTRLSTDGYENCRRIGEVIGRNKVNNPLFVGVCIYDVLRNFSEVIENRKGVLSIWLSWLNVICVEKDISKFINKDCDKGSLDLRFREGDGSIGRAMFRTWIGSELRRLEGFCW